MSRHNVSISLVETLEVPTPDTGTLRGDLEAFLTRTWASAGEPSNATLLRNLARQAARDAQAERLMRAFTATRRAALTAVVERHVDRRDTGTDVALLVDQVFGVLWYRLLLGHAPLDELSALCLARTLARA